MEKAPSVPAAAHVAAKPRKRGKRGKATAKPASGGGNAGGAPLAKGAKAHAGGKRGGDGGRDDGDGSDSARTLEVRWRSQALQLKPQVSTSRLIWTTRRTKITAFARRRDARRRLREYRLLKLQFEV